MKEGAVGGWILFAVGMAAVSWILDGGVTDVMRNGRGWINETLNAEREICGEPTAVEWRAIWTSAAATYVAWPNAILEFLMWSDVARHQTYTYVGLASIEAPPWGPGNMWPLGYITWALLEPLIHIWHVTWLLAVRFSFCESDRFVLAAFFIIFVVMVLGPNVLCWLFSRLWASEPVQRAVKYWEP